MGPAGPDTLFSPTMLLASGFYLKDILLMAMCDTTLNSFTTYLSPFVLHYHFPMNSLECGPMDMGVLLAPFWSISSYTGAAL